MIRFVLEDRTSFPNFKIGMHTLKIQPLSLKNLNTVSCTDTPCVLPFAFRSSQIITG